MHIDQIPLDHLSVSKANMRSGKKPPDISDILPSIIKRDVISPLFVRPGPVPSGAEGCNPGHFEIVAGKRRYYASLEAARLGKDSVTLPCITLGEGDDAEALRGRCKVFGQRGGGCVSGQSPPPPALEDH